MLIYCYLWMFSSLSSAENFNCFLHQKSHSLRMVSLCRASRNPQCSLLPLLSIVSTNVSSMNTTLLLPMSTNFINSPHLLTGHSLFQALHPIIDVTGSSRGLGGSPWPSGMPWASGICFLLHNRVCHSSVAFLDGVYCGLYVGSSPCPSNRTSEVKLNILCISIKTPLIAWVPFKEQDCLPGAWTIPSVMWYPGQASCNISYK